MDKLQNKLIIKTEDEDPFKRRPNRKTIRSQVCGSLILSHGEAYKCTNQHSKVRPTPSGLKNLANTCYQNSILQSLYNIPELREIIHENSHELEGNIKTKLLNVLGNFFKSYKEKNLIFSTMNLRSIKQLVAEENHNFKGNENQCAIDFLEILLSMMEDEAKEVNTENFMDKMFSYEFEYGCCKANRFSLAGKMKIFTLDLSGQAQDVAIDLDECIQKTLECEFCKQNSNFVWKFQPVVFIIHILRTDYEKYRTFKTYHNINFPPVLAGKTNKYKLRSIVSHEGAISKDGNGHWKADVCWFGRWYTCSDLKIVENDYENIFNSRKTTANLLFYVQK